ncbi:hypothetical protein [Meiothermus phage MMP17]|nr:hypothetical protein [Meiothermus phage MMP7]QAY18080.1 hypothetical protein [Meiothermus phage MMP17]
MPRPCTICTHPQRQEIEAELARGELYRRIAPRFGVSERSVRRHLAHTQIAAQQAIQTRVVESGRSILERLRDLNREALGILSDARANGKQRDAIAAIHALTRLLELEARLLGELDHERPQVQVNVLASPEWLALRARLIEALRPYPEAAHAAAKVLVNGHSD